MAKKHEADGASEDQVNGTAHANAPPAGEPDSLPASAMIGEHDDDDEFITLGKGRPSWKPGEHGGITGYLLGESGIPKQDGDVAAIYVIRLTEPAQASTYDKANDKENWRTYPAGTEVQIFVTRGLEDLRPYARDPAGIFKIRLSQGKLIKAGKGKFWDLSPKQVSKKVVARTADDRIEKAPLPRAARATAPANHAGRAAGTDDEIPF
jgi:hypothetical protein